MCEGAQRMLLVYLCIYDFQISFTHSFFVACEKHHDFLGVGFFLCRQALTCFLFQAFFHSFREAYGKMAEKNAIPRCILRSMACTQKMHQKWRKQKQKSILCSAFYISLLDYVKHLSLAFFFVKRKTAGKNNRKNIAKNLFFIQILCVKSP